MDAETLHSAAVKLIDEIIMWDISGRRADRKPEVLIPMTISKQRYYIGQAYAYANRRNAYIHNLEGGVYMDRAYELREIECIRMEFEKLIQ